MVYRFPYLGRIFEKTSYQDMELAALYQLYLGSQQRISIDSRNISQGILFFALKGEHFDGNQFADSAIEQGASYAIVDDPKVVKSKQYILVDHVLKTLQDLALYHRRQFHIPILAITGSNGKTTTKALVANILKTHYRTHSTRGNYNNHIGVPLTLLQMPIDTEVGVIEMGANHQGEIDQLCAITEPTHGLITNIGKAHLEGFGGIEGVKKGKSELYEALASNRGTAFVNRDEKWLESLSEKIKHRIFYKQSEHPSLEEPDYQTVLLKEEPLLQVAFLDKDQTQVEVQSQLYGRYNLNNLMTGICVGKYFKVPAGKIKYAIENYIPSSNRSQLIQWKGNHVLLDAYNANPSSMAGALDHFASLKRQHKVAILGDMLELGSATRMEHEKMIKQLQAAEDIEIKIVVGALFKEVVTDHKVLHFPDATSLKEWILQQDWTDHTILLKASRGIGLERIVEN